VSIEMVDPAVCHLWELHHRLGEAVDEKSCISLLDSVKLHGQRLPALGRRVKSAEGESIELIYGARRLFVARQLGMGLLVDVRDIDDRAGLIEMDIENRVRTDISAYERGLGYRRWLNSGVFSTQLELAQAVGISEAHVSRLLKYAELPSAVVGAFESASVIREEWAVALARQCRDPEQRQGVLRRARAYAQSGDVKPPERVYAVLMGGAAGFAASRSGRDKVVKDSSGTPVLRVSFRAKTIHLIVGREQVSDSSLDEIVEQLRTALEGRNNRRRGGSRSTAREEATSGGAARLA
jgi:ParB family transcriptional regulator, chromosome partitioning protein